jgi:hypothetical protein
MAELDDRPPDDVACLLGILDERFADMRATGNL